MIFFAEEHAAFISILFDTSQCFLAMCCSAVRGGGAKAINSHWSQFQYVVWITSLHGILVTTTHLVCYVDSGWLDLSYNKIAREALQLEPSPFTLRTT